ncbi:hypothetical protein PG987_010360 [Apiospora arundinis]
MSEGHLDIPGDIGIVARLHAACIDSIKVISSQQAEYSLPLQKSFGALSRVLQSLTLWGMDYMVADGTLDNLLQTSKDLQKATLVPLRAIASILVFGASIFDSSLTPASLVNDDRIDMFPSLPVPGQNPTPMSDLRRELAILLEESEIIITQDEQSDEDFDFDKDGYSPSLSDSKSITQTFQTLVSRLTTFTRCLVDLGIAIDCPAKDPEYLHEPGTADVPTALTPHQPYSQKIQEKFPSAPSDLVDHLGKSNLRRRRRIIEQHVEAEDTQVADETPYSDHFHIQEGNIHDRYQVDAYWSWVLDAEFRNSAPRESVFRDSALGSSLPTLASRSHAAMSEISSVLSSMAERSWKAFPQLTEDAKSGKPFECDGCGHYVVMTKTKHWSRTCIMCNIQVPGSVESLLQHISRHLEEISAAALPRNVDSNNGSDTDSQMTASELVSHQSRGGPEIGFEHSHEAKLDNHMNPGIALEELEKKSREFYGYLFEQDRTPTDTFFALLLVIFNYASMFIHDPVTHQSMMPVLSPCQLNTLYDMMKKGISNPLEGVPDEVVGYLFQSTGVQHALMPGGNDNAVPSIPCVTAKGFARWISLQVLLNPDEPFQLLQHAVQHCRLKHPDTGQPFPPHLPRQSLPIGVDVDVGQWAKMCAAELRRGKDNRTAR